jgi:hypothetical protein
MDIKLKNVFLIVALVAVISTMTISVANHAYADRTHHRGHNSHHATNTGIDPTAQNSGIDNTGIDPTAQNSGIDNTGIDPTAQNSGIDNTAIRGHHSNHHATNTGIDPTAQNSGIDNTAIRGHHSNHHATNTGIDPTAQNSGIDNMGNDIFNHGASISPDDSISKNIGTPSSTSSFFGTSFP